MAPIVVRLLRLVVLRLVAMSRAIAIAAGLPRLAIVVVHASTVVRRPMPDEGRSRVRMPAVPQSAVAVSIDCRTMVEVVVTVIVVPEG